MKTRGKAIFAIIACAGITFFLLGGESFSRSTDQTVNDQYPGLVRGVLKNARLEPMKEHILLKSEAGTILREDMDEVLKSRDARMRSQLKKNLLFLLEQEATRQILLDKARESGLANDGRSEQEIFKALFARETQDITITEEEISNFYRGNKDMFNNMSEEQAKGPIRNYLLQVEKQRVISDYVRKLAAEDDIRVNEQWMEEQSRVATDNPVDRARNSGRPTMVEFGATGCVACDKMQPILDRLREDFPDRLNVVFVHVRERKVLAARFGIQSIPTQVFFDAQGREVFRHTGFLPKEKVYKRLAEMGVTRERESSEVFSRGDGSVEVVLFTNYFCPPCQELEPYLEETLPQLASWGVKITFVDAPFNRRSSLYARYFLYAAKSASSMQALVNARSVLFRMAEEEHVESEQKIRQVLKKKDVQIELFDTQSALEKWKELMDKYDLRTTPTAVIVGSGGKRQRYRGGEAITGGLNDLIKELSD